jgi:hypothetical protein
MAKQKGRYGSTGRVTPKGGDDKVEAKNVPTTTSSGRYTPPVPREFKESPLWVPVLMFTLLGLGVLIIIVNYTTLMPGGSNNLYLLLGLALITIGFIVATKYH